MGFNFKLIGIIFLFLGVSFKYYQLTNIIEKKELIINQKDNKIKELNVRLVNAVNVQNSYLNAIDKMNKIIDDNNKRIVEESNRVKTFKAKYEKWKKLSNEKKYSKQVNKILKKSKQSITCEDVNKLLRSIEEIKYEDL